jgi:putative tricarboxylic transport membrane protein
MTIANGEWLALFDSWLSIGLWTFAIVGFLLPIVIGRRARFRPARSTATEGIDPD